MKIEDEITFASKKAQQYLYTKNSDLYRHWNSECIALKEAYEADLSAKKYQFGKNR